MQEKANTSIMAGDISQIEEEPRKELSQIFAPPPGINRDKDGKITVNQDQAAKPQQAISRLALAR